MSWLIHSDPEAEREETIVAAVEIVHTVTKMPAMVSINILEAIRDGYWLCKKCGRCQAAGLDGKICNKCGWACKWMPPI